MVDAMLISMLKAIHTMLDIKPNDNAQEGIARVKCANIMLGEIICALTPPLKALLVRDELDMPEYEVKVHPQTKVLEYILENGVPIDADKSLLIDGKTTKYKYALGKTFAELKVVED